MRNVTIRNITHIKLSLLLGTMALPLGMAYAQTPAPNTPVNPTPAAADSGTSLDEIVVTGVTTKNRKLITASVDVTFASSADIVRKAPKSIAELLELVPGIFVEGTAGGVSNNYSVRGLQGGGQRFISLEEDGLPIVYGGGGADEFFSYDVTIDRLEAVRGGTSGILGVNGAAATINFISKPLSFDKITTIAKLGVQSYGEKRADFYISAPIRDNLAVSLGGYVSSSPGVRKSPFRYDTYHVKGAIEYRFDGGGFVRVTGKIGDQRDAYYADQPYKVGADGKPTSVAGLDSKFGNIGGSSFASIDLPVSTFVSASGYRNFALSKGIEAKTKQIRFDFEKPVTSEISLFAKARYLGLKWDFNGLFPGSGVGNAGLTSAVNYLTPGSTSPINDLLTAGALAFPAEVKFGIKDLRTGQIIASDNAAALNALNGNGFLQQTWLNHDQQQGHDFGSNVGARWEHLESGFNNSLTAGIMYYDAKRSQNQSATSHVINDVRNDSHLYDVVALGGANNVVGTLTDNGVVSYGNWGAGINTTTNKSLSFYFNDELKVGDNLHIDFGVRHETLRATRLDGNSAAVNQPVPAGTAGLATTVGSTFDGTYTTTKKTKNKTAYTVGANYLVLPQLSVYARYAKGFQTQSIDPPADVKLYEAGVRYQGYGVTASATIFRTEFNKQFYNFISPTDPTKQDGFLGDLHTNGFEIDLNYRAASFFSLDAVGVFQKPKLSNVNLSGLAEPQYNGNVPERTPKTIYTVTPTFILPNGLGEVYGRYKYVGKLFADSGNGIALPGYGVSSAGVNVNITQNIQFGASVDNIFSVTGLTEGNPRQGQTQTASSGYFYSRGIVGTTYAANVTFKF